MVAFIVAIDCIDHIVDFVGKLLADTVLEKTFPKRVDIARTFGVIGNDADANDIKAFNLGQSRLPSMVATSMNSAFGLALRIFAIMAAVFFR